MPQTTTPIGLVTPLPRLYPGVQQESLSGAVAAVTGQIYELPSDFTGLPDLYDWEIIFPVTPATVSVQLEGSDDPAFAAANVFIIDGPKTTVTPEKRFVLDKPVRFIRANLTSITGALASCTVRLKNGMKS